MSAAEIVLDGTWKLQAGAESGPTSKNLIDIASAALINARYTYEVRQKLNQDWRARHLKVFRRRGGLSDHAALGVYECPSGALQAGRRRPRDWKIQSTHAQDPSAPNHFLDSISAPRPPGSQPEVPGRGRSAVLV